MRLLLAVVLLSAPVLVRAQTPRAKASDPILPTVQPFGDLLKSVQGLDGAADPGAVLKTVNDVLNQFTKGVGGSNPNLEGLACASPLVKKAMALGLDKIKDVPANVLTGLTVAAMQPSDAGKLMNAPVDALNTAVGAVRNGDPASALKGPMELVTGFNGAFDQLRTLMSQACAQTPAAAFCGQAAGGDPLCGVLGGVQSLHPDLVSRFPDVLKAQPLLHACPEKGAPGKEAGEPKPDAKSAEDPS